MSDNRTEGLQILEKYCDNMKVSEGNIGDHDFVTRYQVIPDRNVSGSDCLLLEELNWQQCLVRTGWEDEEGWFWMEPSALERLKAGEFVSTWEKEQCQTQ